MKKIITLLALFMIAMTSWADDVAQIGETKYSTLQDALNAASANTVQLLKDVTVNDVVTLTHKCTLDLNGHSIKGSSYLYINTNTTPIFTNSSTSGAIYCNIHFYDKSYPLQIDCKMLGGISATTNLTIPSGYSIYLNPNEGNNSFPYEIAPTVDIVGSKYYFIDERDYVHSSAQDVSEKHYGAAYSRTVTIPANADCCFGTLMLPFAPSASLVESLKLYKIGSLSSDVLHLVSAGDILGTNDYGINTPYIFKYLPGSTSTEVRTRTFVLSTSEISSLPAATPVANTNGDWTLTGTYTDVTKSASDNFYYINSTGNSMYKAEGNTHFKPYRAWITYSGGGSAKSFTVVIDDETSGIAKVENDDVQFYMGTIYDLQGRKITTPQKGNIYVVNGKKILF